MEAPTRIAHRSEPEPKGISSHAGKATYKSYKKKYRKMRLKFDHEISINQQQYRDEQTAMEIARRLAIENSQLLDLLHDVNACSAITPAIRFDIKTSGPNLSALPDLIPTLDEITHAQCPEGEAVYEEILALVKKAKPLLPTASRPTRSLSSLLDTFKPKPFTSLPEDQQADLMLDHPVAYLTPDQLDEATSLMDMQLGVEVAPTIHNPNALPSKLSDKELEVLNPNSVYSWLRTNEPQVFLQDGEEPSGGRPGALRGAGKRSSTAHPAILKTEAIQAGAEGGDDELDSEGIPVLSTPATGKNGKAPKRKRPADDDVGYRPEGGSSRPSKKKKSEGGSTKTSVSKIKLANATL